MSSVSSSSNLECGVSEANSPNLNGTTLGCRGNNHFLFFIYNNNTLYFAIQLFSASFGFLSKYFTGGCYGEIIISRIVQRLRDNVIQCIQSDLSEIFLEMRVVNQNLGVSNVQLSSSIHHEHIFDRGTLYRTISLLKIFRASSICCCSASSICLAFSIKAAILF